MYYQKNINGNWTGISEMEFMNALLGAGYENLNEAIKEDIKGHCKFFDAYRQIDDNHNINCVGCEGSKHCTSCLYCENCTTCQRCVHCTQCVRCTLGTQEVLDIDCSKCYCTSHCDRCANADGSAFCAICNDITDCQYCRNVAYARWCVMCSNCTYIDCLTDRHEIYNSSKKWTK